MFYPLPLEYDRRKLSLNVRTGPNITLLQGKNVVFALHLHDKVH